MHKDKRKTRSKKSMMTYETLNKRFSAMRTLLAVAIGVIVAIIVVFAVSDNPMLSVKYLLLGPIMNTNNFYSTVVMWIPIVMTGLAICIMFSGNQFNLFVEGGFFFGGAVATMVALSVKLPGLLHPLFAILAAAVVSGLLATIPGLMKYKLNSSEMVASILLNYVVLQLGIFLVVTFFGDPSAGSVVSAKLPESARLPELISRSNIHIGFFIAIILTVIVYYFMYRTRWGYNIRLIGKNQKFARYSGVSIGFITILSQALGGALAGTAGAIEVLGLYSRFSWTNLTNHGWDGVTLGIIAHQNPKYIPLAAFFLAYLRKGADLMSIKTNMQVDFVSIIQAIILVFLLASRFLSNYKQRKVVELSKQIEMDKELEGGYSIG